MDSSLSGVVRANKLERHQPPITVGKPAAGCLGPWRGADYDRSTAAAPAPWDAATAEALTPVDGGSIRKGLYVRIHQSGFELG
jgi:hypothetical protein